MVARRRIATIAASIALGSAGAQQPGSQNTGSARPFVVGELLTYDVEFGPIKAGTGTMEIRGVENVRGRDAYHTVFRIDGGIPLYRVDDTFESWFATDDLSSLRYIQDKNEGQEGAPAPLRDVPERKTCTTSRKTSSEQPSVEQPR